MRPKWTVFPAVLSIALLFSLAVGRQVVGHGVAAETSEAPSIAVAKTNVTPETASTMDVLTIGTTLQNNAGRADDLYVVMHIRGTDGQEVLQASQKGVGVEGEDHQSVYWVWRLPQRVTAGSYTVAVEVYGPDRATLYAVDEEAAHFAVFER